MKARQPAWALLILAAVAAPCLIQYRSVVHLRAHEEAVRKQAGVLARLSSENDLRSNLLAQAKGSQSLSATQLTELLHLRNAAGQLRGTLKEMDQLRSEIARIRDRAKELASQKEIGAGRPKPTALLEDEIPVRQERVDRLKRWIEDRPEERIPELQFLSEADWIRQETWEAAVTDEEYRLRLSALRGNAELRFGHLTHKALQRYARANDGGFPTDVLQLITYYESPVDAAIFDRYVVVPAKSLTFLDPDWKGGDWVITQKAPVNKKYDARMAVGLGSYRGTVQEGRWESPP